VAAVIGVESGGRRSHPQPGDPVLVLEGPLAPWPGAAGGPAVLGKNPSQKLGLDPVSRHQWQTHDHPPEKSSNLAAAAGKTTALSAPLSTAGPAIAPRPATPTAFADLLQGQLAEAVAAGSAWRPWR